MKKVVRILLKAIRVSAPKIIRYTIVVEVPYDNEQLNYVNKAQDKIIEVLGKKQFAFKTQAGFLEKGKEYANKEE